MVRCTYSVGESRPNRTLSRVETAIYSRRKSLENRAGKAKERVFGNKNKIMKADNDKPLETKAVWWQKNERVCWYREDLNA